jgi:3-hydroxyacyl-CoA dehydrogenase
VSDVTEIASLSAEDIDTGLLGRKTGRGFYRYD